MSRPVLVTQSELGEMLRARLAENFEVASLPPGCRDLSIAGDPVGWLADGSTRIDREVLATAKSLRAIAVHGVGTDFVDLTATRDAGVVVANTGGIVDDAVAELGLGLILALGRDILRSDHYVRSGRWVAEGPDARITAEVHGSTVGILGMGRIGLRLAQLLAPLRPRLLYHNRRPRSDPASAAATWVPRAELFASSDYVVAILPLTDETRRSIGADEFAQMRPSAFFVNLGRGAVVDTSALIAALESGAIAGAALDVFEEEPLPASSPLVALDNVILQPHVASATARTRDAMLRAAVDDLVRGIRGLPLRSPVPPPV